MFLYKNYCILQIDVVVLTKLITLQTAVVAFDKLGSLKIMSSFKAGASCHQKFISARVVLELHDVRTAPDLDCFHWFSHRGRA